MTTRLIFSVFAAASLAGCAASSPTVSQAPAPLPVATQAPVADYRTLDEKIHDIDEFIKESIQADHDIEMQSEIDMANQRAAAAEDAANEAMAEQMK
jgi:hypothetical protein